MKIRLAAIVVLIASALILMPSSAFARSLYIGLSGSDVKTLQQTLISQSFLADGYDTGYFGPLTQTAVQKFQCAQQIVCSGTTANGYGVYGPKTQAALAAATDYPANPSSIPVSAPLTPAATGAFEVSGWLPYWRVASGTVDVLDHISTLTSVMPFSYTVSSDGILTNTTRFDVEPWASFIEAARLSKVRVVPSILWGDGAAMQAVLSDTAKRIALEDQIASLVKTKGFDGIDIDFEGKEHETINYFSTFLKGLYLRMGQKWVYCTVEARMPLQDRYLPGDTVPPDATDYANDYIAMNKYCDRVEIMAYDQSTVDKRLNQARAAPYAPVADPGWVEDVVQLAAQTISRNKLVLGIPTYGYEYKVTPLADSSYQYERLWPFDLNYATNIAAQLGITPTRTSADEIGFIYYPSLLPAPPSDNGDITPQETATTTLAQNQRSESLSPLTPFNYVTWSDAKAIQDKVELAHKLGLRGVAIFKFDGGEDPGVWSVLK